MNHCFNCHWFATFVAVLLLFTTGSLSEDTTLQVLSGDEAVNSVSASRSDTLVLNCVLSKHESSVSDISLKWGKGAVKTEVSSKLIPSQSQNRIDRQLEIIVTEKNCGTYFCSASGSKGDFHQEIKVSVGMDGGWSSWTQWPSCSGQCNGVSQVQRTRNCNNPSPVNGGKTCQGMRTDERNCISATECVGHWMEWSSWGMCRRGYQTSTRQCRGKCDGSPGNSMQRPCDSDQKRASQSGPEHSLLPTTGEPSKAPGKSVSDPSNLVITVAVSSALVGLLLCVAIIACWRRLHLEQRGAYHRSEDEDATQAILLSLTDSGPGISADDYPEDPTLTRELDAVPPGVALLYAPGSFAEALQGIPPPPNPFFVSPGQGTQFHNSNNQEAVGNLGIDQTNEETSTADRQRQDLQSPEEEFAHLKEGITEDELPVADTNDDDPPLDIF